jgi:N-acetylglucosaminyldiphosphoundecaprenol N-acetyl-beta-D-mannosaminyltransferase
MTRFDSPKQGNESDSRELIFQPVKLIGHEFLTGGEEHFNRLIFNHIETDCRDALILAHHNLHSLFLFQRDENLTAYFKQTRYIWIDGMAVLWILKLLGYDAANKWRLTFLDWQHSFFARASDANARIFLLGSSKGIIEKTMQELSTLYPMIKFANHHGYVDIQAEKNTPLIDAINDFNADILLVGMGMPKQEAWILSNQDLLNCKVIMPLGGYFDYIAGETYMPPRLSGKLGLEWLFRLASDPKRLYRRYLLEPWFVILKLIKNR